MNRLDQLFQQFLRERTYINNVTAATREWCESAWKEFTAARAETPAQAVSAPLITKADLQFFVVHLRQRGVRPVSCNTWSAPSMRSAAGFTSRANYRRA